jgi:hypothetical protein
MARNTASLPWLYPLKEEQLPDTVVRMRSISFFFTFFLMF